MRALWISWLFLLGLAAQAEEPRLKIAMMSPRAEPGVAQGTAEEVAVARPRDYQEAGEALALRLLSLWARPNRPLHRLGMGPVYKWQSEDAFRPREPGPIPEGM